MCGFRDLSNTFKELLWTFWSSSKFAYCTARKLTVQLTHKIYGRGKITWLTVWMIMMIVYCFYHALQANFHPVNSPFIINLCINQQNLQSMQSLSCVFCQTNLIDGGCNEAFNDDEKAEGYPYIRMVNEAERFPSKTRFEGIYRVKCHES